MARLHSATALGHSTSRALIRIQKAQNLVLKSVETIYVGNIVHSDASVRTTEVGLRKREEAFLAGGVPDLELDDTALNAHVSTPLIDGDSAVLVFVKDVVSKPQ